MCKIAIEFGDVINPQFRPYSLPGDFKSVNDRIRINSDEKLNSFGLEPKTISAVVYI